MPSARIVPGVRTLLGRAAENFADLYFQARIKFFQENSQRSTHNACTDENDVSMIRGEEGCCHSFSPFVIQVLRLHIALESFGVPLVAIFFLPINGPRERRNRSARPQTSTAIRKAISGRLTRSGSNAFVSFHKCVTPLSLQWLA